MLSVRSARNKSNLVCFVCLDYTLVYIYYNLKKRYRI